jgi:hypothetical protein
MRCNSKWRAQGNHCTREVRPEVAWARTHHFFGLCFGVDHVGEDRHGALDDLRVQMHHACVPAKWDCASGTGQVGLCKWDCASGAVQVGLCASGTARGGEPDCEDVFMLKKLKNLRADSTAQRVATQAHVAMEYTMLQRRPTVQRSTARLSAQKPTNLRGDNVPCATARTRNDLGRCDAVWCAACSLCCSTHTHTHTPSNAHATRNTQHATRNTQHAAHKHTHARARTHTHRQYCLELAVERRRDLDRVEPVANHLHVTARRLRRRPHD